MKFVCVCAGCGCVLLQHALIIQTLEQLNVSLIKVFCRRCVQLWFPLECIARIQRLFQEVDLFFDHQDKWIYLLLNTLFNLVVFLTPTKRQNQQTTHFQLWLCGFVLCMQSFIHPGRLTAGTNKSPMKKRKHKKIFEKKSKKKNLQEMMLPAVKIFQGVKPVISHGFFLFDCEIGSEVFLRQMAGTYAPEILRRVWKEVRSAISDPWSVSHQ